MPIYNAPIQDMKFILNDVFNAADFWQKNEQLAHVDSDTVNMILEEMSKFAKNTLMPHLAPSVNNRLHNNTAS